MDAYSLRVYGRVQRVGFRRFVLDSAQELGLSGYAKNLADGSIEIFVQGEKEQLSKFVDAMRQAPPPVEIRDVEKEEADVNPDVKEFKLVSGELSEEFQEGFGAMQAVFTEYWKEFRDYRKEFGGFKDEFRDYRQEFRNELGGYRQEFRSELGGYRQEFRDFAKKTDESFKSMADKYGEISAKLTVILETLIRESRETKEMLNESLRALREAIDRLPKAA